MRSDENPLYFRVGNTQYSVVDELVWIPFAVLLIPMWVGLVLLAGMFGQAQLVTDLTLGWILFLYGDFGIHAIGSLFFDAIALILLYLLYIKVYKKVLGIFIA